MTINRDVELTQEIHVLPKDDPDHDRRAHQQLEAIRGLVSCQHCGGSRWVRALAGSGDVPCLVCNSSEGAS
jgi:hypothetical protein